MVILGIALALSQKGPDDPLAAYRDPSRLVVVPATVTQLRARPGPAGAEGLPDARSVRVVLADAGTPSGGWAADDARLAGLEHQTHAGLRGLHVGGTVVVAHPWGSSAEAVPAELPALVPPPRGTHGPQAWAVLASATFPLGVALLSLRARARGARGIGDGRAGPLLALLLMGVQTFLLMGAVSYVLTTRDANASLSWPEAPGEVVTSRVVERGGNAFSQVAFEYEVGSRRYRADTPEWTLLVNGNRADAAAFAARYPRGPVTVRYDPADPSRAVIRPGPVQDQTEPLGWLFGTAAAWLLGLWFLLRRRGAAPIPKAVAGEGAGPG